MAFICSRTHMPPKESMAAAVGYSAALSSPVMQLISVNAHISVSESGWEMPNMAETARENFPIMPVTDKTEVSDAKKIMTAQMISILFPPLTTEFTIVSAEKSSLAVGLLLSGTGLRIFIMVSKMRFAVKLERNRASPALTLTEPTNILCPTVPMTNAGPLE